MSLRRQPGSQYFSNVRSDDELRKIIIDRLKQYDDFDLPELNRMLVERWRAAHPTAVEQGQSQWLKPLIRMPEIRKRSPDDPDEVWHNDVYHVTLRRKEDKVFGSDGGMVQLGISCFDGTAGHDWRDFQAIKNQLAGPECEAFELYPAESRLLDPSNYYSLWCFPGVRRLKVGIETRSVVDADLAMAPQRPLAVKPPEVIDDRVETAGQVAYDAYRQNAAATGFGGLFPPFAELPDQLRRQWEAAAAAVALRYGAIY